MDTDGELSNEKVNENEKSGCQSCLSFFITSIIIFVVVLFSGCAISMYLWPGPPSGEEIEKIVNNNKDEILAAINNGTINDLKIDGVEDISIASDYSIIDFSCGYSGSAISGNYSGFYYSRDDEPDGVSNSDETSKGHWINREGKDSDNYYETYKICDNFYYYFRHC